MLLNWFFIIIGLAALIAGAEALVRGASGVALMTRMTPMVIGLTVVAAGTSMPELMVSVRASLSGDAGLAVGNVVGSNILNIGLVLGLTALVKSLKIQGTTMKFEWPVLVLATAQVIMFSRDGLIDRMEGGFLFIAVIVFMAYAVGLNRNGIVDEDGKPPATASFGRTGGAAWMFNLAAVAIGGILLALGADTMVRGAVAVALGLGISQSVVGLTIVAVGTSSPELVTSVMAAFRGRDDMAVGNVVGSSIFNLLAILGAAALARPLPISEEVLGRDFWWLAGMTLLLLPLMWTGRRIARIEGFILIAGFVAFTTVLWTNLS
ncbi:MAG: calcium/sodium antiporter [Spirochaetaceae bacterium]|nr:calcium/sodium antiporter [Spirochaetaceae bacterium]